MNARLPNTGQPWVDPDDAPDMSDADLSNAVWSIGGKVVTREEGEAAMRLKMRGRPPLEFKRPMLSMRVDPDVLEKLRASGKGWQTRLNAVLREVVEQGRV